MAQSTGGSRPIWDLGPVKTSECDEDAAARCWYMFFASHEAPYRQLWMADLTMRNPDPENANLIEIDIIQMYEGDDTDVKGNDDFLLYTLRFKCKERKYRVADGFALRIDGSIEESKGAGDWHGGYEDTWVGLAGKIACEKKFHLAPDANHRVFLGDFHRPVDAVDITRGILWQPR